MFVSSGTVGPRASVALILIRLAAMSGGMTVGLVLVIELEAGRSETGTREETRRRRCEREVIIELRCDLFGLGVIVPVGLWGAFGYWWGGMRRGIYWDCSLFGLWWLRRDWVVQSRKSLLWSESWNKACGDGKACFWLVDGLYHSFRSYQVMAMGS